MPTAVSRLEPIERMELDFTILYSVDLRNFQHFAAFIAQSAEMDNHLNPGGNLLPDRRKRQIHPHQNHHLKTV